MHAAKLLLICLAVAVIIYIGFVLTLYLLGRKQGARAWAGFIPDCIILFKRLISDPKVPKSSKLWLGGLILYLAMPIDLVPDFIPIAGQLDDAIIVALVLRQVLRKAGAGPIRQHWPGPPSSLDTLSKFVIPSSGRNAHR
jgi:uncharacterized membrane protein YkvA (DUF1232 family)